MELILWRHAQAEDGVIDSRRRLTDKGRRQARRVARWLRARMRGDWVVLASPAVRARETADALGLPYEVRPALAVGAAEQAIIRESGWPGGHRNVIVVGHQPTLGRVAALLLTGRPGDLPVRKGAVWWLAGQTGRGTAPRDVILRAVIAPSFAGRR